MLQIVADLFANGRTSWQVTELFLTRLYRRRAQPLGFHDPHHLVHASRIAYEGGEKHRKRLEASQRISEGVSLWRSLAFLLIQIRDRSQSPLRLPTHTEKSAFGSGFRGQQKGKLRLLQPVTHACAQTLKLMEEGQLGIVMFQGIGHKVADVTDPRRPIGSLK